LTDAQGKLIDTIEIRLQQRHASDHHERTFISNIDGSVQYFSVAPSTSSEKNQALVLSVHGAGVEARNQARAYSKKDWTNLVAATNRRPYGFNWEVWGAIDGMEVLAEAKRLFEPDPSRIYLTGHSMGGHGTWYLGVAYPDHFAAIAPCASYPDVVGYAQQNADRIHETEPQYEMFKRGANAGRTLELKRNYLQSGVYIFHGDADRTVSPEQARLMRRILGEFHLNFCYYEYPGGEHWFGNHSVDWPPIFDYFKLNSIPTPQQKNHIEFHTASPGVSASNYWTRIDRQTQSFRFSNVVFDHAKDTITGTTDNVQGLTLFLSMFDLKNTPALVIDGQYLNIGDPTKVVHLSKNQGRWTTVAEVNTSQKHAARHGGFKSAFENRMVFVYATGGNREENEWYRNKAGFDAETFLYRGNGSIEVIADRDFNPNNYPDNNIVVYGNASNHRAWNLLLAHSPVQVGKGEIRFGEQILKGNDLAAYFIYPRNDSPTASVGVVAGTGVEGMKATFANNYISGITGFPDLMIFNTDMLKDGLKGVKISGFFGYDWSIEKGDFVQ
jgi:pimeloyl-ACP methyl ester carboxylesterase